MKKIIPFLVCMLIALWACEKDSPNPPASVDSMQFEGAPTTVDEGADISLSQYLIITPEAVGDTVTVEWSSSDKEIATVSASGSVEALRAGTVIITAKAMDKTAQVKLTIDKVKIKEFTIPAKLEVYVGEKIKFPINDLKPKNAPLYRFDWEADNDGKIPTYSEGKWYLKADKEREYTLTASVDDAEDAKCVVKFIKPLVDKLVFNPASYTIEEGGSLSLESNLQITPAKDIDANTIKVIWSSSNESVATIDQNGKVQSVAAGKTTITAKAGNKTATCTVEVTAKPGSEDQGSEDQGGDNQGGNAGETPGDDEEDSEESAYPDLGPYSMVEGHECVDLGLSVKWAMCNLGAATPYDDGSPYCWGETKPRTSSGSYQGTYAYKEKPQVLPMSNDAANANWGGKWRMPTMTEMDELLKNCTITSSKTAGKIGIYVTSKINGNKIFIPLDTSDDYYWTSSLRDDTWVYALHVRDFSSPIIDSNRKWIAYLIRPVHP